MTGQTASAQQVIPRPRVQGPQETRFYEVAERYIDGTLGLNPTSATYYGYHKYDGNLEDFSQAGLARRLEFYKSAAGELAFLKRADLSPAVAPWSPRRPSRPVPPPAPRSQDCSPRHTFQV